MRDGIGAQPRAIQNMEGGALARALSGSRPRGRPCLQLQSDPRDLDP